MIGSAICLAPGLRIINFYILIIALARCSCDQNGRRSYDQTFHDTVGWPTCQGGGEKTSVGQETILFVADACPRSHPEPGVDSCYHIGDIDASINGYRLLTGNEEQARLKTTYEFVPCPIDYALGPTKIRFDNLMDKWGFELLPVDHRSQIIRVTIQYGLNAWKYDMAFDHSSHKWIFRVSSTCLGPLWIEINGVYHKAWRWLRSVGPKELSFENPVIFELWNEHGDSARGIVTSYNHMLEHAEGKYLSLDGWL